MFCNTFYPLKADVYYATETQNDFGEMDRQWDLDRTVPVDFNMSTNYKDQQVQPDQFFWIQDMLGGKCSEDIRVDSSGSQHSLTNILVTNVRNGSDTVIYYETAGERAGEPTIYEVAGLLPHNDPWGNNDYYKLVVRRSDIQEMVD